MSIKAKISVDSSQLNSGLKKAESQAASSGSKIKQNLQQAGKGFESVNKIGGKMGGVFKNVTQSIKGLISPMGLVMAGITLAIQGAIKLWDMFTESAEQAAMKAKFACDQTVQATAKASQQSSMDEGYFDRLMEINNATKITNEMNMEARTIIQQLTRSYGDLGLSIDKTTGKILGLDQAQEKFLQKQKQIKIQQQEAKYQAALQEANQAASEATGGKIRDLSGNRDAGKKRGKTSRKIFGGPLANYLASDFTDIYAGWDDGKGSKQAEAYEAFKAGSTFDDKINYLQKQVDLSNDKKQIANLQKIIVALKKAKVQKQKFTLIKGYGGTSPQEAVDAMKKLSEQSLGETKVQQADENIQETKALQKIALNNFAKDPKSQKSRRLAISYTEIAKAAKQDKLKALQDESSKLGDRQIELNNEIEIMQMRPDHKAKIAYDATYRKKYASLLKSYNQVKKQNKELQKQKRDVESSIRQDDNTLYKLKEQPTKKFKQFVKTSAQTELDTLDKLLGKEKEVAKAQALRNAEKAKGAALTDEQKKKVKDLADLQWDLKQAQTNKLAFGDMSIKTNELTRRGGFASGAVMPDKQNVNNAIKQYAMRQVQLLTDIRNKLNNGGYI